VATGLIPREFLSRPAQEVAPDRVAEQLAALRVTVNDAAAWAATSGA